MENLKVKYVVNLEISSGKLSVSIIFFIDIEKENKNMFVMLKK